MSGGIDQLLWVLTKDMKDGESFTFSICATKRGKKVTYLTAAESKPTTKRAEQPEERARND